MNRQEYNGYTNYETWAVFTWMSNDAATQTYWSEAAHTAWLTAKANDTFTKSEAARIALAETLKGEHEDTAPDLGANVWADLLNAALSEVDWMDAADTLLNNEDGYEPIS